MGALPLYVIRPEGPYAHKAYGQLLAAFGSQFPEQKPSPDQKPTPEQKESPEPKKKPVEWIAVPGVITGRATLYNGQQVPVVNPDLRGLCKWNINAVIDAAKKAMSGTPDLTPEQSTKLDELADEFLHRIYFELRNAGRAPQERALNYAGTNLFQPMDILAKMLHANHALDTIGAERSTVCRPGSDCWDITLSFFNPDQPMQTVRWIHRFTVDVSEVIPVTVGETRSWKAR
jgi:cyanobactin maturation PatA/PatG family protease